VTENTSHDTERPEVPDEPPPEEPRLAQQLAETEDRFKRALADLDNYRKRSGREIERRLEEDRERRLLDWLEAVDSVDRALAQEAGSGVSEGLRGIRDQMEAISVRPDDGVPDRTVLAVARPGYAIGGRLLRPAQVIVARAPQRQT
jgi:molecular chaperone GrpE